MSIKQKKCKVCGTLFTPSKPMHSHTTRKTLREALAHRMRDQSRLHSLLETLSSIAIGFCVSLGITAVMLGVDMETGEIK